MRIAAKIALLLIVVAALSACQAAYVPAPLPPPSFPLAGTSWVMSSVGGALPLPGTTVTLQFGADGSASGTDGCNRFNTTYTQDGYTLTFGQPGASTMMACAEAVMSQATAFSAALARTTNFTAAGNQLSLRDDSAVLATFVATVQDLAGTSWQVTAYNNGREAVVSVLDGTELTAEFAADGQVSGDAGCNQYFGPFTTGSSTGSNTIAVGPLGATMRFCDSPPGVMQQESEFLAALESAATFSIEGNDLQLRTAADALAVQMTRRLVVDLPEPEPEAETPMGRVVAPQGVNVRTGPGANFPVIGVAPFGEEGEIVGRSADGAWWAVAMPAAPGGIGWVSADFVVATNAEDVPVMAAPPPPVVVVPTVPAPPVTATPLPPPTATPAAQMTFSANPTTIDQGQCSTLSWSVENVQAVWVYPQGEPYNLYPRTGQGSEQVCPTVTTTYEMRVLLRDGSTAFQQVTVTVNPATAVPPASDPLAGTRWNVIAFNNGGGAVVTPISGSHLTADFADGRVTGSAGCNSYAAGYQASGNTISVGPTTGGMMMCAEPAGVMEQEGQFLAALQSAATFRITGDTMELRTAGDQIAVTLNRAP